MKLGTTEILAILAVVVIVFGPTQIPKLTRMFGKSVKSFREGMGDDGDGSQAAGKGTKDAENKDI